MRISYLKNFQCCFRAHLSTETALIRVLKNLLLDLSSVFDTVDHNVLLGRLKNLVGVTGVALDWFSSYLTNRSFSIWLGETLSSHSPLLCGAPQGSILGPLLLTIYMLPLGQIIRRQNIEFHFYADDTQSYVSSKSTFSNAFDTSCITSCLKEVKHWMFGNFLKPNDAKTEVIVVGPHVCDTGYSSYPSSILSSLSLHIQKETRNLSVIFDSGDQSYSAMLCTTEAAEKD